MAVNWYCSIGGVVYGPVTTQELKRMAASGRIARTDEVKRGEEGKWVAAVRVQGLNFGGGAPRPQRAAAVSQPATVRGMARAGVAISVLAVVGIWGLTA